MSLGFFIGLIVAIALGVFIGTHFKETLKAIDIAGGFVFRIIEPLIYAAFGYLAISVGNHFIKSDLSPWLGCGLGFINYFQRNNDETKSWVHQKAIKYESEPFKWSNITWVGWLFIFIPLILIIVFGVRYLMIP